MIASSEHHNRLIPLSDNATNKMTTQASVWPQPLMPDQENVASSTGDVPLKEYISVRGHSDSIVPSCRVTREKNLEINSFAGISNGKRTSAMNKTAILPLHVRARQNLRLPSFKALGIASRLPDALLTPPDESTIQFRKPAPPSYFSRSSSFPTSIPKTPSSDLTDFALNMGNVLSTEASSSTQPAVPTAETEGMETEPDRSGPMSSSSEEEELPPNYPGWLVEAVEAVGKLRRSR